MPRKRKSGLDYWLENCYNCEHMIRTHYIHDGKDYGSVGYKCRLTGQCVTPWYIDGCRKFLVGIPEEIIVEIKKEKKNEESADKGNTKT